MHELDDVAAILPVADPFAEEIRRLRSQHHPVDHVGLALMNLLVLAGMCCPFHKRSRQNDELSNTVRCDRASWRTSHDEKVLSLETLGLTRSRLPLDRRFQRMPPAAIVQQQLFRVVAGLTSDFHDQLLQTTAQQETGRVHRRRRGFIVLQRLARSPKASGRSPCSAPVLDREHLHITCVDPEKCETAARLSCTFFRV